MDLDKLTLFGMMKGKLRWLNQRQDVLAQNVANADTPGYRARDLKAFDFQDMVKRPQNKLNMNATTAGHLAGRVQRNGVADETIGPSYETSPDGNAVVLEEQMGKVGENQLSHRLITELYRKQISMLKTAIGKNR